MEERKVGGGLGGEHGGSYVTLHTTSYQEQGQSWEGGAKSSQRSNGG